MSVVAPVWPAPPAVPLGAEAAGDLRFCSLCGADRPFDRPLCADGHDDCPESFCRACGAAVLIGGVGTVGAFAAGSTRRVAGQHLGAAN